MARQGINTGSSPNDGTGDNLRAAGGKINDNFTELYGYFGDGSTLSRGTWDVTSAGINTLSSVGIGTTNPQGTLQVGAAITMDGTSGIITATSFSGDGSSLTGLTGASAATYGDASNVAQIVVDANGKITGISEVSISGGGGGGSSKWADYDTSTGISTTKKVKIENDLEVTGVTTSTTFSGNITGVAATFTGNVSAVDGTFTGDASVRNLTGVAATFTGGLVNVETSGVPAIISHWNSSKHLQMSTGDLGGGFNITDVNYFAFNHQPYADRGTNNNLTERLRISSGGALFSGIVTATSFVGALTGNVTGNVTGNATGLTGSPSITVTNINAADITASGTLTYEDVTNVDSIGIVTARGGFEIGASGVGGTITSVGNAEFTGVTTAQAFAGFDYLQAPHGTTVNYSVTVAAKTAAHRYNGTGSGNGYVINGVESPFLTLTPGRTYRFTLDSSDMTSHPFRFYLEADKTTAYTTNVTSTATYTEIVVTDSTPQVLHYQCSSHEYMGNAVSTNSSAVVPSETAIFRGGLVEKFENAGTTLALQTNNPLSDGNLILFTGNESGSTTINFTGVHSTLSSGETVSFNVILTPNNSGRITTVQVDSEAITVKWAGGITPTAGASGQDVYSFQILKTGTATTDYEIYGAATNYA